MHGGAHPGAGHPPQNKGTTDAVLSRSQLFSGPSLSTPGSSKIIHPLFRGSDNDSQISLTSDGSFNFQPDAMEGVSGSENSPTPTCEFQIPSIINNN